MKLHINKHIYTYIICMPVYAEIFTHNSLDFRPSLVWITQNFPD